MQHFLPCDVGAVVFFSLIMAQTLVTKENVTNPSVAELVFSTECASCACSLL